MGQVAMTQCLMGVQCKDFTMIASDQSSFIGQFLLLKNDLERVMPIADNIIMGVNGENGDIQQFSQFIANHLELYKIKNGYQLDTAAAVHFTRKTLVDLLKGPSGAPIILDFLIGGWDETNGGQLYSLDLSGTLTQVPFAVQGLGGLVCVSILEYYYKPDMTESQAYEVMQMCVKEVHERISFNLPNFQVKVVSRTGISTLPTLCKQRIVASPGLIIKPDDPKPKTF